MAMRPGEEQLLDVVRTLTHARKAADVVAVLRDKIDGIVSGARSRTFTGIAFDAYCRALLAAEGHTEAVREQVRHLCERSRAHFGDQPWSSLYDGCLLHLAGEDEAAATEYALASRDVSVLWPISVACRTVLGPRRRDAFARMTPQLQDVTHEKTVEAAGAVLCVACDHAYLRRFGPSYLRSVHEHGGGITLHVHVVNPEPDDVDWIEREAPALWPRIAVSTETYRGPDARQYYALVRFMRIAGLAERYGQPVLVTDIDAAFTGVLDLAAAPSDPKDVSLMFKRTDFRAHPWNTIQARALIVWPTERGRIFARALGSVAAALFAERAGLGIWMTDQNILFSLYRKYEREHAWRFGDVGDRRLAGGLLHGKNL